MPQRTQTAPVIEPPIALPDTVPACHALIHQLMQRLSLLEERVTPPSHPPATAPQPLRAPANPKAANHSVGNPATKAAFGPWCPSKTFITASNASHPRNATTAARRSMSMATKPSVARSPACLCWKNSSRGCCAGYLRSSTAVFTNCYPRTGNRTALEQLGLRRRLAGLGVAITRICFAFVGGVGWTLTFHNH
jgi:hypothetical protein